MEFRHVKRGADGDIEYVEYRLKCTGSVVRLYRDPDSETGWVPEERTIGGRV